MKYYYDELETEVKNTLMQENEIGCGFCWDKKRKRSKELFFLDAANNMRICDYCPSCGRVLND